MCVSVRVDTNKGMLVYEILPLTFVPAHAHYAHGRVQACPHPHENVYKYIHKHTHIRTYMYRMARAHSTTPRRSRMSMKLMERRTHSSILQPSKGASTCCGSC